MANRAIITKSELGIVLVTSSFTCLFLDLYNFKTNTKKANHRPSAEQPQEQGQNLYFPILTRKNRREDTEILSRKLNFDSDFWILLLGSLEGKESGSRNFGQTVTVRGERSKGSGGA
jgi:hypothetical protein